MESIMHNDGRVIKSGNNWKYEYHIKDHPLVKPKA